MVGEHTKSDAGYRTIYVVSSALELFAQIKEYNLQRGFSWGEEGYIFIYRGSCITSQASYLSDAKKYDKHGISAMFIA